MAKQSNAGIRNDNPSHRPSGDLSTSADASAGQSAGSAARDTADPNFTAASRDHSEAASAQQQPAAPRHVRDVMTADLAVCNPGTQLYYVAKMMEERDCGAVPVVESTDSMRPVGILTDRDIVIRALARNQEALNLKAEDVMSVDLLQVNPDLPLEDCSSQMEQRQLRRALVVDHTGRCCGIIAQADIARVRPQNESGEFLRDLSQPNAGHQSGRYH